MLSLKIKKLCLSKRRESFLYLIFGVCFLLITIIGCGGSDNTVTGDGGGSACATLTTDQQSQVSNYITTARNSLFKSTVYESDFNSAKSAIANALTIDSCNADANLLGAIIDIGTESERISDDVLYTPDTIFPVVGAYSVQKNLLAQVIMPITNTFTTAITKMKSFKNFKTKSNLKEKFTSDNPQPSEVQAEIEATTLTILNNVITKLEKVKNYTDSNSSWTFSYPKDPANTGLGNNTLDGTDIKALIGAVKLVRGFTYFGLAYNWDTTSGWWDTHTLPFNITYNAKIADPNNDGILTPDEYFPPSPFGTLKSSGTTYLSSAQTDVASGLTLIKEAVDTVLAESTPTGGGITLTSQQIADANHYKHFLSELVTSFSGTSTSTTIPDVTECWQKSGNYYYAKTFNDSSYNSSSYSCVFSVTKRPYITANVKLSNLFSPISEWKSLSPTFTKGTDTWVISSLPESTLNGIFPDGFQKSWFDETTANRYFDPKILDTNATSSGCNNITNKATLKIGSTTFTANSCYYSSTNKGYYVDFSRSSSSIPTSSDVYTYNSLYGTSATLSVSGYNNINLIITDNFFWISVTP